MDTANDLIGLGKPRVATDPRNAKIHDYGHAIIHAVPQYHDVARLDVAVNHPSLVGIGQAIADVNNDPEPLRKRQGDSFLDHRVQAGTFQELHHQIGIAVLLAEVINGDDVRTLERSCRPRFRLEAIQQVLVPAAGDHLDRHVAANLGVDGFVDNAHAASA